MNTKRWLASAYCRTFIHTIWIYFDCGVINRCWQQETYWWLDFTWAITELWWNVELKMSKRFDNTSREKEGERESDVVILWFDEMHSGIIFMLELIFICTQKRYWYWFFEFSPLSNLSWHYTKYMFDSWMFPNLLLSLLDFFSLKNHLNIIILCHVSFFAIFSSCMMYA